jgi:transcriptional regulator with XRE-family HTH domain
MTKTALRERAVYLRSLGYSYNLIKEKTGVSKSTLSEWLSDLPYKPNSQVINRINNTTKKLVEARRRDKISSIMRAKKEAEEELPRISNRDLWMLGLGLYIGEGSKDDSQVRFVNSNSQTVRIMARWFREVIGLKTENFTPSLHIYPDNDEEEAKKFWSKLIKVPICQFAKTNVDQRTNKSRARHGTLPYGTMHLTISAKGNPRFGAFLSRKIRFWSEQVAK